MRIEVKLYASLGHYMPGERGGASSQHVEVEKGTTVAGLLQMIHVPLDTVKLMFLNGIHARMDQVLQEGDRLGVFPPVAGG